MAELRVRLKFDYPPPAGPESRQMWMLLNPEHLRTVTDLSDLIRARYYPHHRGALCLYVHDCLLPPGESVRLIRDNDVIRVQWNGHDPEDDDMDSDSQAQPSKKRSRQKCEDVEESSTILSKKRNFEPQRAEAHRSRKEKIVLEETEQEQSLESSRRKTKKKRQEQEAFPEVSLERNKGNKHSEGSTSLKAAKQILSLLRPNLESPTKGVSASSGSPTQEPSTSHQEPSENNSEISIQPITNIPLKTPSTVSLSLFAALSVSKKSGLSVQNIGTLSINRPSEMSLKPIITFSGKKPSSKSKKLTTALSAKRLPEIPLKPVNKQNNEPPVRSARQTRDISSSDSEPSGDQESSTKGRKPPKKLNKAGTAVSVNKTKPNHELPAESETAVSSSDSEPSGDQESSTKGKKPPKELNKVGTAVSVNKTKPNHKLLAERETAISPSASSASSSDQESTVGKKPSKVFNNAGATVSLNKINPNHEPSAERVRSSVDYSASSYDQELSTARKNPSEATSNLSDHVSEKTVFSPEMRNKKDGSVSDNGDTRKRRSVDAVTTPPLNGSSQKQHKVFLSSGSDSDTGIIQKTVTVQHISSVAPSCVTDGRETGGVQQGPVSNPVLYGCGRGRGRDFLSWRGQGGRGFRGRGDQGKGRGYGRQFFHSYGPPDLKKQQLEEPASNTSVIIQNPPEIPNKDYSAFPLLAAPPQIGKVIAFKILELNENYSPELSDYKEGIVRSYDPVTQQIEVELLSKQKKREPGKFDLVYESEDGKEIVEYAILPDRKVVEPWSSLITPRLVIEYGSGEGTFPQPL